MRKNIETSYPLLRPFINLSPRQAKKKILATLNNNTCFDAYGQLNAEVYYGEKGSFGKPKLSKNAIRHYRRLYRFIDRHLDLDVWTKERNANNCIVERAHFPNRERYHYDFKLCPSPEWEQFDTDQDASYFGVWVNLTTRQVLTFAEGDETRVTAENDADFRKELQRLIDFYEPAPAYSTIDEQGVLTRHYVQTSVHDYLGVKIDDILTSKV